MTNLSPIERELIKKSYFNLLALFFQQPAIDPNHVRCLIKWALQLGITPDDIIHPDQHLNKITFSTPSNRIDKLKAVYHLVYMIHLDKIVEDSELEVAMIYAQKIGLEKAIVANLFQSIATASYDGVSPENMEMEIVGFFDKNQL